MIERQDLGAQLGQATRRLIALEQPILAKHGITMWEYIVLLRLRNGPTRSQLELARAIRYDKTRLIALLDRLQQHGLVARDPVPEDRRARYVQLSADGRAKVDAVQRDIQQMEDKLFTADELQALGHLIGRI